MADADHPCEREEPQSGVGVSSSGHRKLAADPAVVDGIMYLTQRPNDVIALDATTGRVFWTYRHTNEAVIACCGSNNRGVAILGELLYMGTLDGHLVAIEARSGREAWKTRVADSKQGYSITVSPLALKDRVVIGVGGGEYGIRGFISSYDAQTGKELWRFYTIPGPGEPGHETWEACPIRRHTATRRHGSTAARRSG